MTPDLVLDFIWKVGGVLVAVIAAVYTWWKNNEKKNDEEVYALDAKLTNRIDAFSSETSSYRIEARRVTDEHGRRITLLEEGYKNSPKVVDLILLRETISKLEIAVSRAAGAQDEQARMLNMLHEYILRQGYKGRDS